MKTRTSQKKESARKPKRNAGGPGITEFEANVARQPDGSFRVWPGRPVVPMLRVADIARRLGVTKCHVLNLIEEGKLEAVNVGGGSRNFWRIPPIAFEKFLADQSSLAEGSP